MQLNNMGRRPIFPYLQAVYRSFYSEELYRDILNKNKDSYTPIKGLGFSYLIMIVATLSLLVTMLIFTSISALSPAQGAREFVKASRINPKAPLLDEWNLILNRLHKLPTIRIHNGELQTPEDRPYYIQDTPTKTTAQQERESLKTLKDTTKPRYFMVLDTSGKYDSPQAADASYLVTKTEIIDANSRTTLLNALDAIDEAQANYVFKFLEQIPPLSFRNTFLEMPGTPSPHHIEFSRGLDAETSTAHSLVIIDTKGTITSLTPEDDAAALLTQDELNIRIGSDIHRLIWERANNETYMEFTEKIFASVKSYLLWGVAILFLLILAAGSILMIAASLILGLFGHSLGKIWRIPNAEYADYVRLSAVALTPMVFLALLFPAVIGNNGLILCVIAAGYTGFAVYANRSESHNPQ